MSSGSRWLAAVWRRFPNAAQGATTFAPGCRVIGLARRMTIAFHVGGGRVTIDRILYGGRDLGAALDDGCGC